MPRRPRLLAPVADRADVRWYAAVGAIGDLGAEAPFPEVAEAKRAFGGKNLSETVALGNAAKRAGGRDTAMSLAALLAAVEPAAVAKGRVLQAPPLTTYRTEVATERARCAKTAPRFAREWALLLFAFPCQVHGHVASIWVGRLPTAVVMAATVGYTPCNVHFSLRTRRPDDDLLARLRAFRTRVGAPELGQGHPQATGGVLPIPGFAVLLRELGFDPSLVHRAATDVPSG